MNIILSELQVIESGAITKRLAGLLGEETEAIETYNLKATPSVLGVYNPISITPVSFDYFGGIAVKGSGMSEYVYNDANLLTGKSFFINGPAPKNEAGTIAIAPLYKIIDYAEIEDAVQDELDPTKWVLTPADKNYLYSKVTGTPITGKLAVLGRSFILSASGRLATIVIDTVLKEGDVLETMTSDEYNQRVAEEIQYKLDLFFGTEFATATYNTTTKCYEITLQEAGSVNIGISATLTEDLSYFGFISPTYAVGSEDLDFPKVALLTGDLAGLSGYDADITGPQTIEVTIPVEDGATEDDLIGQRMILGNVEELTYEVVVYG